MQSKKGLLKEEFKKFNFNEKDYRISTKGDFSILKSSDILISLGWQSIALKASFAFKKPFIFYTRNKFPYSENIFSLDKVINEKIILYTKTLWYNQESFSKKMDQIINEKDYFQYIKEKSASLINEIGFYEGELEDYLNNYFY